MAARPPLALAAAPRTLRRTAALLAMLVAAAGAGACGGDDRTGRDGDSATAVADSALEHDLALAASTSGLPETFGDTALGGRAPARPTPKAPAPREVPRGNTGAPSPAPRPSSPRPAPAAQPREVQQPAPVAQAPAPAPATAPATTGARGPRLATGTGIAVATNQRVCTKGNLPGDKITATVARDVTGEDGARIPAGSKVVLEVASVTRGAKPEDATIVFRIRTLDDGARSYPASGRGEGEDLVKERTTTRGTDAKKVAAGAAVGAILGQVLGKDSKGTIIGAAAGAAAGAGAAAATSQYDGCLPAGAPVRITLDAPVIMA